MPKPNQAHADEAQTDTESEFKNILQDIKTKTVVPIWPHAAKACGLSRNSAYAAAHRGEIEVAYFGKLMKAISAPLRKKLGIEAA